MSETPACKQTHKPAVLHQAIDAVMAMPTRQVPFAAKALYQHLLRKQWGKGLVYARIPALASDLGACRATILEARNRLRDAGLLTWERKAPSQVPGSRTNRQLTVYTVQLAPSIQAQVPEHEAPSAQYPGAQAPSIQAHERLVSRRATGTRTGNEKREQQQHGASSPESPEPSGGTGGVVVVEAAPGAGEGSGDRGAAAPHRDGGMGMLAEAGVSEATARELADQHNADRIRDVTAHAKQVAKGPGYIVAALRDGWTVPTKARTFTGPPISESIDAECQAEWTRWQREARAGNPQAATAVQAASEWASCNNRHPWQYGPIQERVRHADRGEREKLRRLAREDQEQAEAAQDAWDRQCFDQLAPEQQERVIAAVEAKGGRSANAVRYGRQLKGPKWRDVFIAPHVIPTAKTLFPDAFPAKQDVASAALGEDRVDLAEVSAT